MPKKVKGQCLVLPDVRCVRCRCVVMLYRLFIYLFIYTYNDILNNAEAINVEVMMRMLKILWKETERKRVVENWGEQICECSCCHWRCALLQSVIR